ncbi:MAG: septum site-determining protein MinC [Lachnospiraceae bacterium]
MSQSVILKSNKYGINLLLDKEVPLETLIEDIIEKFKESEKFFKNAKIAIAFEGRELSTEEEREIILAITERTNIKIACIMDKNQDLEERMHQKLETFDLEESTRTGQFYKGTLRSGQVLESETSIVILGDVNPGAKVIAKGNIVILGTLKGNAYAGAAGNETAFVAALEMDPMQIKIADIIGRSADGAVWSVRDRKKAPDPEIAMLIDGCICINPITKGFMKSI